VSVSARTQVAGVIGDPIGHSLSPLIHNAAYAALGLDWIYLGFQVAAGAAGRAVSGAKALGMRGLSVTMPHKQQVASCVERLSEAAAELGAANTVVINGGEALGDNTDGAGFVVALREELSFVPAGKRCLVAGTGGAARAIIRALAAEGAEQIAVLGRDAEQAGAAASLGGRRGRVITQAGEADVEADLIVSATPALAGGGLLATAAFGSGQVVVDVVYDPPETDLMRLATTAGATVANGLGMLVHQAALQFKLFTGEEAPLAVMWGAVTGGSDPAN
jgi:shikimate dehydrogenase